MCSTCVNLFNKTTECYVTACGMYEKCAIFKTDLNDWSK